jgi:hypothetical protein
MSVDLKSLSHAPINKEKLNLASHLSKMFPECDEVYAIFIKDHFYLFSDSGLNKVLSDANISSLGARRIQSRIYQIR